ncbi:hypothetical protein CROQUDRAFT_94895 [Cronartium quercuum f. sp. fusiforme G11]|uniref:RRM domain-containing protein n=1 Tax=Cronartium quercuum f. sp. fusiforme G11 TaxID=708437 RepID=A0A9P6ND50_9BASI|nr:hypothetical protein CROQUDRAFT_94895 [Cronartium quercuum f. sp. fusiforme G11]
MFGKILQHLVQFSDEVHNESRPTIECGILTGLQALQSSPLTESTSFTQFTNDSFPSNLSSYFPTLENAFDPLICLNEPSEFKMSQQVIEEEMGYSRTCQSLNRSMAGGSPFIGSGMLSATANEFGGSCQPTAQGQSDLVGSPPFASELYARSHQQFSRSTVRQDRSHSSNSLVAELLSSQGHPIDKEPRARFDSIFSSSEPSHRKLTNIFVANFPAHWGKSDLVDLFEGIPIASVHVLPEKRTGDESSNGGTGFVNVIRREDAEAILGLLDKKIWLIEGSALKFRLANSSAPSEPTNLNPTQRIRTIRRHPHKILDRLRAEQIIWNRQVGACEKHHIVVYKNMFSNGSSALSVVHSSRQRNNHMSCTNPEPPARPAPSARTLIDELRVYLNRSNRYNQQHAVTHPPPQGARAVLGPGPYAGRVSSTPVPATFSTSAPAPTSSYASAPALATPFGRAPSLLSLGVVRGNLPKTEGSLHMSVPRMVGGQLVHLPTPTNAGCCYVAVYQPPQTITTPGYFRAVPYALRDENDPMSVHVMNSMRNEQV